MQVPKIEDGNNFGVSVQLDVANGINELMKPVATTLDGLPGYFEARAKAWSNLAVSISKETKTSTSSTKETGGKVRTTVSFLFSSFSPVG